ncbi:methyltransferase, FxLD system [Nocardioides sp. NPDC057772]|uniref:methyltransferase, FxLD system n=1 Tax=Nocardioides sp. NPDC057772 TaxID=3346245 RepID=UPI0036724C85
MSVIQVTTNGPREEAVRTVPANVHGGRHSARAILIDDSGRLLLIKRTKPGQAPYWTTPGGGVEPTDASVEDALHRELAEELGATAAGVGRVFLHSSRSPDGVRIEHYFIARLVSLDLSRRTGPEVEDPSRGTYDLDQIELGEGSLDAIDLKPQALKSFILSNSGALLGEVAAHGLRDARTAMVGKIASRGQVTSPAVLGALRTVPREEFVPAGTPLSQVYDPDDAVITRRDDRGDPLSSVSAPGLQGRMIEQAAITSGSRVLEIGSGGYNAALLAEVVGEDGVVLTVDIDPWVTDRARECLAATGYRDRVEVITADAEEPLYGHEAFDAIIVTVGAWDIPPAWIDQLAPAGRLVVPLRMRSITRAIRFRRDDDHLVSESAEVCGFVPMQGIGRHDELEVDVKGTDVGLTLRFDEQLPTQADELTRAVDFARVDAWAGVTVGRMVDFSGLYLWFVCSLEGFCRAIPAADSTLASELGIRYFPFGAAVGGSFAVLRMRQNGEEFEFGATGFGPDAGRVAAHVVEQIQAWDQRGRPAEPKFTYWPRRTKAHTSPSGVTELQKNHGVLTISWA